MKKETRDKSRSDWTEWEYFLHSFVCIMCVGYTKAIYCKRLTATTKTFEEHCNTISCVVLRLINTEQALLFAQTQSSIQTYEGCQNDLVCHYLSSLVKIVDISKTNTPFKDVKSYRLISLLQTFCKILEKILSVSSIFLLWDGKSQ